MGDIPFVGQLLQRGRLYPPRNFSPGLERWRTAGAVFQRRRVHDTKRGQNWGILI